MLAGLLLIATVGAVEPDDTLEPLTPAALREFVTQHEVALKRCLRAELGTAPSTLTVTLTAAGPGGSVPAAEAPVRGDRTPDPWVRTLDRTLEPKSSKKLESCVRRPIETFFRNVSFAYEAPRGTVTETVVYRDLNARPPELAARAAEAEATVRARIAERQDDLDRCLTDRHPDRFRGPVAFLALADGDVNLEHIDEPKGAPDLEACVAGALELPRQRVGDRGAEPFTVEVELTRPTAPRAFQPPELEPQPM
jgi:hypothetical protein